MRSLSFPLRSKLEVVIVLIVAVGVGWGIWAVENHSHPSTTSNAASTPIQFLYQGGGFRSLVDNENRTVTYTFDLENGNAFGVDVFHAGASMPGLTLEKNVGWTTPRKDRPQSSLSETLTFRVIDCGLIPRGIVNMPLQVSSLDGSWQTIWISPVGGATRQWQTYLTAPLCLTPSQ